MIHSFAHSWHPRGFAAIALCVHVHFALAACSDEAAIAHLGAVQGEVTLDHQPAISKQAICPNTELITGSNSSAVVEFTAAHAILRFEQGTALQFKEAAPQVRVGLLRGAINAFFRKPGELSVDTPIVNASIKGTEFLVRADVDGSSTVSVFEGIVGVSGKTSLAASLKPVTGAIDVNGGQKLVAHPGDDLGAASLQVAVAKDELAWSLYYPPIVEPTAASEIQQASKLLWAGRIDQAELLLAAPEFVNNANALALKATIAVVRNNKEAALALAQAAVKASPDAAAPRIALSYAHQAHFNVDRALATLVACVERENRLTRPPSSQNLEKPICSSSKGQDHPAYRSMNSIQPSRVTESARP